MNPNSTYNEDQTNSPSFAELSSAPTLDTPAANQQPVVESAAPAPAAPAPVPAQEAMPPAAEVPAGEVAETMQPVEEVVLTPAIYRDGNELILENGAVPMSHLCIKSGRRVKSETKVGLRSPFKPATWFKCEKVSIGLSRKNLEKHRINMALSISLITLGLIMIPVGIMSGLVTAILGVVVTFAGLILRAISPVWISGSKNSIVIRGAGEDYLKHYSEKESV